MFAAHGGQRADRADGPLGRAGRDLERGAVVLPGLVPPSRHDVLHHVHGPMWDQIMPPPLAGAGRLLEARVAPPFYRRTRTVTPSEATREELLGLGFRPDLVTAVDNGTDPYFSPGGERWPDPTVVAVGAAGAGQALRAAARVGGRGTGDGARRSLRIVGDGPLRPELEAWIRDHDAGGWATLLGHVTRGQLRDEYRRAWIVASASLAEGWGLSLTEGAACGTPAVATDISGHRCSVVDGVTGVLAPPGDLGGGDRRGARRRRPAGAPRRRGPGPGPDAHLGRQRARRAARCSTGSVRRAASGA